MTTYHSIIYLKCPKKPLIGTLIENHLLSLMFKLCNVSTTGLDMHIITKMIDLVVSCKVKGALKEQQAHCMLSRMLPHS